MHHATSAHYGNKIWNFVSQFWMTRWGGRGKTYLDVIIFLNFRKRNGIITTNYQFHYSFLSLQQKQVLWNFKFI